MSININQGKQNAEIGTKMILLKEWDKIIPHEGKANRTTISSMIGTALANTRVDSWQ